MSVDDTFDSLLGLGYLKSKDIVVGYAVYKGTFGMNVRNKKP
jgi:hypothetical protein